MRPSISPGLPAPAMMVVLSLSIVTFLAAAQLFDLHVFKLEAEILRDGFPTGEDRDVFEHGLAAIAEARSFNGSTLNSAAEFINDKGGQCFAFEILRNDEQRLSQFGSLLKEWQKIFHRTDFLFVDEDVDVIETHSIRSGSVTK